MSRHQKLIFSRGLAAAAVAAALVVLVVFYSVVEGAVERSKSPRGAMAQVAAAS